MALRLILVMAFQFLPAIEVFVMKKGKCETLDPSIDALRLYDEQIELNLIGEYSGKKR